MRKIASGYLYKRGGVYGGRKFTDSGFLYGDALASAMIILFILPVVLSVFWLASLSVQRAYYWDHILQDTLTYLEEAKCEYYKTGHVTAGDYPSQFIISNGMNITYRKGAALIDIKGVPMQHITVQALDNGHIVYTLCTDIEH
nr:hypothetical protein [Veillonella denticariosi]